MAEETLEEAIARVAARRGVPSANYVVQETARRTLSASQVRSVFTIPGQPVEADFGVYDHLPPRSRFALRELRLQTFSPRYLELLIQMGDEEALIDAVRAEESDVIRERCLDRYGASHPQALQL